MDEATAAPARARFTPLQLGIVVLAVAFGVLAALVVAGHLDSLDRYAIDHWMPGLEPERARDTIPPVEGVFLPFELTASPWWDRLLDSVMYPASVLVSFTIFAVGSCVLWRRGAKVVAVAWGALWFVANALEVGAKIAISKPALYATQDGTTHHLAAFDHSYPSGHMMRAVLVTALVLYVWRRLGRVAAAWAAAVPVCLVVAAWHVPSDVAGGLLFGLLMVLGTYAVISAVSARRA
jgi:membrane-associated phospholipid phosphatase